MAASFYFTHRLIGLLIKFVALHANSDSSKIT